MSRLGLESICRLGGWHPSGNLTSVCHCEESCLAGGDGAVVDSCSCSHDALQAVRRFMQLRVQEAERVRRGPSMHLPIHALCSRSHWLQQSLSRDFKVEQPKVKTLSKTIKTSKPHRFLFNLRSLHPLLTASYFAVVDSCSCSHDVLQAIRRSVQLCVQEAERVRSRPCQHLFVHIVCSRSHWL
jgi:hypothetical protein